MASNLYAQVIVDLEAKRFNRPFIYQVPSKLSKKCALGSYVLVPFRNKKLGGFIVGFQEASDRRETKPIEKVLSKASLFESPGLELSQWLAGHYHCLLIDALRCLIPRYIAIKQKEKVKLRFRGKIDKLVGDLKEKRPLEAKIVEIIAGKDGEIALEKLKKAIGLEDISKPLRWLKKKKIVENKMVISVPRGLSTFERPLKKAKGEEKAPTTKALPFFQFPEGLRGLHRFLEESLERAEKEVVLLFGTPREERINIYLEAIDGVLNKDRQAIVLVPEIFLTIQTAKAFEERFGRRVVILHGRLSDKEQYQKWQLIRRGQVDIVVGPRSAVFAPLPRLGLIIVDEEQETYYKQENAPRYHAREVALKRAEQEKALVILGSLNPSLEAYHWAKEGKFKFCQAGTKYIPKVEIIDLRREVLGVRTQIFSFPLHQTVADKLRKREQVILFLNRKGFSTFLLCQECGFVWQCRRCAVSLTYHLDERKLRCHHCNFSAPPPDICPYCEGYQIVQFGFGTERVAAEAQRLFPKAKILRLDSEVIEKREDAEKVVEEFNSGKAQILIGTQLITKGFKFPVASLISVVSADTALYLPDFRAAETTFKLLAELINITKDNDAKIMIQTYNPQHYALEAARSGDFEKFYQSEILCRQQLFYPPFSKLANLVVSQGNERIARELIEKVSQALKVSKRQLDSPVQILGPAPAPYFRLKGKYRWHILLKSKEWADLHNLIDYAFDKLSDREKDLVVVDVDPLEIM